MVAPIGVFAHRRIDTLDRLLAKLVGQDVTVFVDPGDVDVAGMVRSRYGTFRVVVRDDHIGLVRNIEMGVAEILESKGSGIFLEDDLLIGDHCIEYFQNALASLRGRPEVFCVNGFAPYTGFFPGECALIPFASSWGWATWADRWEGIDLAPEVRLDSEEEIYLWALTANDAKYRSSDWLWKWRYHILKRNGLALTPKMAMCTHVGFDHDSTHFTAHKTNYPIYMNNKINETSTAVEDLEFYHTMRKGMSRVPGVETIAEEV